MYSGCWPARLGQSGVTLLPSTPWHAAHVADFARPASTEPCAARFRSGLRFARGRRVLRARDRTVRGPESRRHECGSEHSKRQISRSSDARSRWTIPIDFTRKPAADCTLRPGSERESQLPTCPHRSSSRVPRRPRIFRRTTGARSRSSAARTPASPTALNLLAGVRKLARVSKTPGRTQLVNFFAIGDQRRLVDLPGYGFARVPPGTQERWRVLSRRISRCVARSSE